MTVKESKRPNEGDNGRARTGEGRSAARKTCTSGLISSGCSHLTVDSFCLLSVSFHPRSAIRVRIRASQAGKAFASVAL